MDEKLIAWLGVTSAIVTIGAAVDSWLVEDLQLKLSELIKAGFREGPTRWFHAVEEAFSSVFDFFYRWRNPGLDKVIWRGILFTYAGLILARLVMWALRIPVPPMEKILVIAFVIAFGLSMMLQTNFALLLNSKNSSDLSLPQLWKNTDFTSSVILGTLTATMFTAAAIMTGHGMGVSFKNVTAISIGAGVGVPVVALVVRVKDDWIPVSPLRAIGSSLFFIALLSIVFPSAARSFINHVNTAGYMILATVSFNVFGDALSLVETKWVLKLARNRPFIAIVGILLLDLLLSALIYLVLPGISNVNWTTLLAAIRFKGPEPWMGILFWSTFLTSFLFYLFVASIFFIRIVVPLGPIFNALDRWFTIYRRPMRLITVSMVFVETAVFIGVSVFHRLSTS